MNAIFDTQRLFRQALRLQSEIIKILKEYSHSKTACSTLSRQVNKSHSYIEDLNASYSDNKHYFENSRYYPIFSNYVKVLETVVGFLTEFQQKGMFMRFIQRDTYKRSLFILSEEIERSLGALKHGLSLKIGREDIAGGKALEDAGKDLDLSLTTFGGLMGQVSGSDGQKVNLMKDLSNLEQTDSSDDMLTQVELPSRQIKLIDDQYPRQGRNFAVYKRRYKDTEVAEKVYRGSVQDKRMLNQIAKQITILKKLEVCSHILKFYGIHRRTNFFGLVTEFAEFGNLKEFIVMEDKGIDLDDRFKTSMTFQMTEAVAFLHSLDIIHKNIKTSSFMVTTSYTLKLSGFEFSREAGTATVQVVDIGSDRYRWLPPEKLKNNTSQVSTTKGDIYSLSLCLWSLWSELYPYANLKTRMEIEEFVLEGHRDSLYKLPEFISPTIQRGLSHMKEHRPTADELIDLLDCHLPKTDSSNNSIYGDTDLTYASSDTSTIAKNTYVATRLPIPDDIDSNKDTKNLNKEVEQIESKLSKVTIENGLTPLPSQNDFFLPRRSSQSRNWEDIYPDSSSLATNQTTPLRSNYNFVVDNTNTFNSMSAPTSNRFNSRKYNSELSAGLPSQSISHHTKPDGFNSSLAHTEPRMNPTTLELNIPKSSSAASRPKSPHHLSPYHAHHRSPQPLIPSLSNVTIESAIQLHNTKQYSLAYQQFLHLHSTFHLAQASYFLGYYHFWGHSSAVPKSLPLAHQYLSHAAHQHDSDALDLLGLIYKDPEYAHHDDAKAFKCFSEAAKLGNRKGYYHMFASYVSGIGIPKDLEKAKQMLTISAKMGYPSAIQQAQRLNLNI